MTFKDTIKKPKTWIIILFIIGILAFIYYIFFILLKTPPIQPSIICDSPKIRKICPDNTIQCIDVCEPGKSWDCTQKKCICNEGTSLCNKSTMCCEQCQNDVCCSADRQIQNSDGSYACCNPGAVPNPSKNECTSICGLGNYQNGCDINQECVLIDNLSQTSYDNIKNLGENDPNWRGSIWDDTTKTGKISFCSGKPTCSWENAKSLPYVDSATGAYTYYNFSGASGENGEELCFPRDISDTSGDCYSNKSEMDCNNDRCQWLNILNEYATDDNKTTTLLNNWTTFKNQSTDGYYCGDKTTPYARLEKVSEQSQQYGQCSWQDCVSRVSNNGTVQVVWDDTNKICTALKGGTTEGGIQNLVQCTGLGEPCSSCEQAGEYVDCIKCIGKNNPCQTCKSEGDYTPRENCKKSNWEFKPCVPNNDQVISQVFNYNCENCDEKTTYSGNCPWGGNDSTNNNEYTKDETLGGLYHGEENTNHQSCYSDGQIRIPTKVCYNASTSPSEHGSICKQDIGNNCTEKSYNTYDQCVDANPCDNGWFLNDTKTDCNIYACTLDGSAMDPKKPENNADKYFDYGEMVYNNNRYAASCYRKNIGLNPDDRQYCKVDGFTCDRNDPTSQTHPGYGNWSCNYEVTDCTGIIDDTIGVNTTKGKMNYYYNAPNGHWYNSLDGLTVPPKNLQANQNNYPNIPFGFAGITPPIIPN
jgi:hypothetical protein